MNFKEFRKKTMPLRKTHPGRHPVLRAWVIYGMQIPASPFSYFLSIFNITANQISILRVILCILVLPLFLLSNGPIILGLLTFYFCLISDCMDGQLARFHGTNSLEGSFVDSVTSAIMRPSILISVGLITYNWSGSILGLLLVCFVLGFQGLCTQAKNSTIMKLLFSQNTSLSIEDRSVNERGLRMPDKSEDGQFYQNGLKYIVLMLLNHTYFLLIRVVTAVGIGMIMDNNVIIIYFFLSGTLFFAIRNELKSSFKTYKDKQITRAVNKYL